LEVDESYYSGIVEGRDCENARWSGRRRRLAGALLVLVLAPSFVAPAACRWGGRRGTLPATLTDEEFWRLSSEFSEPPGAFEHSDNLVSNETHIVHMVPMLRPMRGVYIGVGPEQNFTYIARLQPAMAFIVDIRQENRSLHLMYKALFEVSTDRADFISRLFSRERPAGVGSRTSAQDLFARFETAKRDERLYEATTTLFRDRLLVDHRFPMSSDDLAAIDHAFHGFYSSGPDIHYGREFPGESPDPSYRFLMTATDVWGQNGSYLATEDNFRFVKDLHAGNLIVPVVGDFAGPQAIRRVGDYVRQHAMTVSAFYGSNVEVYLNRRQTAAFCINLAALPYTSWTWFIGSKGMRPLRSKLKNCATTLP
jgi:hypothetical protein